jgi:ribonuclease P protein component
MRLPSRLRLNQSADFARLRADGRTFGGRALVLSARRIDGLRDFQFGLITSKKVGIAVLRNQTRRRLREIIRQHLAEIAPGWHWVVIARWKAPQLSLAELEKDWLHLARRAGILLRPPSSPPPIPPPHEAA